MEGTVIQSYGPNASHRPAHCTALQRKQYRLSHLRLYARPCRLIKPPTRTSVSFLSPFPATPLLITATPPGLAPTMQDVDASTPNAMTASLQGH